MSGGDTPGTPAVEQPDAAKAVSANQGGGGRRATDQGGANHAQANKAGADTQGEAQNNAGRTPPQSPVDAAQDADRRQFSEAYERGRNLTTDGPMAFIRDSTVEDMHIGDRNFYYTLSGGARAFRSGSVRPDVLEWLRDRYVPVPGYQHMLSTLRDRRVLVLYGQPGTGRFTTALKLLDEMTKGAISRFDGTRGLASLTEEDFTPGRGYVAELSRPVAAGLTELELDRIRDLAVDRSYLVLVCRHYEVDRAGFDRAIRDEKAHADASQDGLQGGDGGIDDEPHEPGEVLGGYADVYLPPDTTALLRRYLGVELRDNPDIDPEVLLARFNQNDRLQRALGPAPQPVETVQMATFLARLGRGEIDIAQVETQCGRLVHRQVEEWFAELDVPASPELAEALRLMAFRVALAVLNESPPDMVTKAGISLAARFLAAVPKARSMDEHASLFTNDHSTTLPASRAHTVDGSVSFGIVGVPTKLAAFVDDRFPVVLLSHLWQHHHDLRTAVGDWLTELSADDQPMVWVRAAQATGLFCSLSFHETFPTVIHPCASEEGPAGEQRRRFAAVALDHAARDERVVDAVYERLRHWRRHGDDAQRWTAVAALGYDLGLRRIDPALEELRVLGTPSELRPTMEHWRDHTLVQAAGYSMANLLAFGAVRPVLRRLDDWTRSNRQSVRELAWWSIVKLIGLHGFELSRLTHSGARTDRPDTRDRERWPLLLALSELDSDLVDPIADLLRWGLRARRGDLIAKHMLGPWIRATEGDRRCLAALTRFLPHLVRDHDDVRRLRHLITRLRHDWADPLDDATATTLEHTIDMTTSAAAGSTAMATT